MEDDDEPEEEEGADDSTAADQSNASPAQDESSSDAMEPQTEKPLPQPNGYVLSTEEENSSEATAAQDPQGQDDDNATTIKKAPSEEEKETEVIPDPQECVNGDESMDSIDSEANEKESGSCKKEVTASFKDGEHAASEDVVQECKANDCTPAPDGVASDGAHENKGTVLSRSSIGLSLCRCQIKCLGFCKIRCYECRVCQCRQIKCLCCG